MTKMTDRLIAGCLLGALSFVSPRALVAADSRAFFATLVGDEEVPPVDSAAVGRAVATLDEDDRLAVTVRTSGFTTPFLKAHLHHGARGVDGPIILTIRCNDRGTSCRAQSGPLDPTIVDALVAGETYVNFHTAAFPDGEIRGQLLGTEQAGEEAAVTRLSGSVKGLGRDGSDIRISGRFVTSDSLTFSVSTLVIHDLLGDAAGSSELVRGVDGQPVLPLPFVLAHRTKRREATYVTRVTDGPSCRMKIKARGQRNFDFILECRADGGVSVPFAPRECEAGAPSANVVTSFTLNARRVVQVAVAARWSCTRKDGLIRELKTVTGSTAERNTPPRADFTAQPTSGVAPLAVEFSNASSDLDGDELTFLWDFGDGTQSTEVSPLHTFDAPGEFTVVLVATDARGLVSDPKSVRITAATPSSVSSTTTTSSSTTTSPQPNTTTTVTSPGSTGTVASTTSTTSAPGSSTSTPTSSTTSTTTHGQRNNAPRAQFRAVPASGPAPLTVTFLNDSSDADGDALRFRWDFGDGSLSAEVDPTHTFTVPGQFAVVLVATDSRGLASEPNLERITVRGPATTTTASTSTTTSRPPTTTTVTPTSTTSTTVVGPNAAPRADFRADPASGPAPLVVRFSNASSDRDGDALSFLWDFGDGTQSREENPVHRFDEAGEFTVVLVATDARGLASAPKQERITVRRGTTTTSSSTTSATAPPTTSTTLRRR